MSTHPIQGNAEPPRLSFKEQKLPAEPKTDVALELEDGTILRERITRIDHNQGVTFAFTFTELDKNGKVKTAPDGSALISPVHEVAFMGENATRLGTDAEIKAALTAGREVGAARAVGHFAGLKLLGPIMKDRLA